MYVYFFYIYLRRERDSLVRTAVWSCPQASCVILYLLRAGTFCGVCSFAVKLWPRPSWPLRKHKTRHAIINRRKRGDHRRR